MNCRAYLPLILVAVSCPTWGQTASSTDQKELLNNLQTKINNMEKRLVELEAKQCTSGPPSRGSTGVPDSKPRVLTTQAPAERTNPSEHGQMPSEFTENVPSLKFRGFFNVDFGATDQHGISSGFRLGEFVLHTSSQLSKKISAFSELAFVAEPEDSSLHVERAFVRYDFNDSFKLSFGRFHTPVDYWDVTFHHGAWLQTTIGQPEMVLFHGPFLPAHFVGFLAEGAIPSGPLGLRYNVGLGNGRSFFIMEPGQAGDSNNNRAWVLNINAHPPALRSLQVGGSVYRDDLVNAVDSGLQPAPEVLPGPPGFREFIASAHVVWSGEKPEFLTEFANVHHRNNQTGASFNSQGVYAQIAYRLPFQEKRWKPYYRFEYFNIPSGEPFFADSPDLDHERSIVGIRYDISDFSAFKVEYRNVLPRPGMSRINGVFAQSAFTF